jgi:hypothetical protein
MRTGGRTTVAAVPRTQLSGPLHAITVVIAHCIGAEPSYGGAAEDADTLASSNTPELSNRVVVFTVTSGLH